MKKLFSLKGGIHPAYDGKALAREEAIQNAPLLAKYLVALQQGIGAPPEVLVAVGDKVKKGQLLAKAGGFVSSPIHAPSSGTVESFTETPGATGAPVRTLVLAADGLDEAVEFRGIADWTTAEPKELLRKIADAGIVGMGGAAFPTHVKLSPPPDKKIDYLLLNGAECEPYLTADARLMEESPERVVTGCRIMGRILGVEKLYIGVENNKPEAIAALRKAAEGTPVEVVGLATRYPQGGEKQLIRVLTGRVVPSGGLPMDAGCVVQNVGSAAAVADAVTQGIPLIERVVTVTGEAIRHPGNWRLRIGTPVLEAVRLAGGVVEEPGKLILGGPMMGFAQKSFGGTVQKNTSGILLLPERMVRQYESHECLRCGKCLSVCPMRLFPSQLATFSESEKYEDCAAGHVMDCIECGACAYTCPAHRPLVQYIRRAKAEIRRKQPKK
ncbi:MAG: electron transport complex subunit RsxC [Victivallaceae bacterium]|nr:electron transport complex subunit RsxC [Victivallaceae bacterium]